MPKPDWRRGAGLLGEKGRAIAVKKTSSARCGFWGSVSFHVESDEADSSASGWGDLADERWEEMKVRGRASAHDVAPPAIARWRPRRRATEATTRRA